MKNSQTPRSKKARATAATRWNDGKIAAGYKRVMVMLPPDTAAMLDQLAVEYKTKTDAIIAAIRALAAKSGEK